MPRNITTQGETLQDLKQLATSMAANSAEISHLDSPRIRLEAILQQAGELVTHQAALAASRQETSKQLRELITEARRLGNFLRVGLKEHYGPRSEKLAEYRLQPFRGRKSAKPDEPEAPTEATLASPEAKAP